MVGVLLALAAAPAPVAAQEFGVLVARADTAEQQGRFGDAAVLYEHAYGRSGFDPVLLAIAAADAGRAGDVALLQDRVLAGEGRPQIYGTQVRWSDKPGPPVLDSIADEPCVDVRHAAGTHSDP